MLAYTDKNDSITGDLNGLVIFDRGSRWLESYPIKSLSELDVYNRMQFFEGPSRHSVIQHVYSDDATALKKAMENLGILHDTAVPGQPATNGVAERQVQAVIGGTRAL